MSDSLAGKVAVVTGGAQGIGEAISHRLAEEGATVAIWDLDEELAAKTASALDGSGHAAVGVDVSDTASVEKATKATEEQVGSASILVNNAANATVPVPLIELSDAEWQRTLDVNLGGAFRCLRALAPGMVRAKSGSIINIAALTAFTGLREAPGGYAATKGGIVALSYAAAAQLAQHGIRVNVVAPGTTRTQRLAKQPPERFAELASKMLLKPNGGDNRVAEPSEIADAVRFLASAESSWITGQSLLVNGGQLFH